MIAALFAALPSAAEERLTLVSAWNRRQNFTELFMEYVEAVNEAGRGIVRIDFRGGPEVIPQRQLLYALRRGVIDMAFGGMTYYRGVLPEGDAMFAATITPQRARANGGLDALQPYWNERINAHLIGWMQSGIGPHIYLSEPPVFRDDGLPDLSGLKIRTSPTNVELIKALDARAVQIAVKEVYTAFQRGTVDGLAWPTIGFPDLGIGEFEEDVYGLTVGGPIVKDQLFFFANYESFETTRPSNSQTIDNIAGVTQADVNEAISIFQNEYGFDPGR